MFRFEVSRFLCFCEIHSFKICDVIKALVHNGSYTYAYFFLILSTIKMTFGQILVCSTANISNMFLARCCGLETSFRPFYDFIIQ